MMKRTYTALILTTLLALSACSTRKDSMKNRAYHNMTSWFNTLFNGQVAMDEKLEELKTAYTDDYFDVLKVEPFDEFGVNDNPEIIMEDDIMMTPGQGPNVMGRMQSGNLLNNETSNKTGFEKAEEKALKTIAKHSMLIKNKERNRLISRAYLMLGQSRYYLGKPFQAMDALQQVQRLPFDKHNEDAKYYTALAQVQAGNKFAAAKILDEMYENEELDKQMTADVAKQLAWLYYLENDYGSALNGLDKAIENTKNRKEEARLNFIQGQILTKMGRLDEANAKFKRAYKMKPGFEMEARSIVAAAMNYDPLVSDYSNYKQQLIKAYKTGTYEKYRNEFMYALGMIEMKRDSVKLAETTLKKALSEEMSDSRFRAETYAAMGDLKFNQSDYVYAGAYYDSAVSTIGAGDRKDELTKYRDDLKTVMDKYYLVKRNDSILRLVAMSDTERETFFNDFIEDLKAKDELKRQEEEEQATIFRTQTKGSSFNSSFEDSSGKFYFYSNAAKSNGESEFKRVWGNIRLKDNWRISTAGTSIEDQKAELTGTSDLSNPRRYELAFYLEKIPTETKVLNDLKVERDTVELSLGIDYFDKFKDAKLSTNTLEHLVETPPKDEPVLLKAYYNLYRVNIERNPVLAAKFKDIILNQYPNTIYAEFILNPEADFAEENSPEVLALYAEAYDAYKAEDYPLVKEKATQAFEEHSLEKIIAKFALLNAYADAALEGEEKYRASLERVIVLYPGTDEAKHAQHLLGLLNNKNKPKSKKNQVNQPKNGNSKKPSEQDEKIMNVQQNKKDKDEKTKKEKIKGKGASPFKK